MLVGQATRLCGAQWEARAVIKENLFDSSYGAQDLLIGKTICLLLA